MLAAGKDAKKGEELQEQLNRIREKCPLRHPCDMETTGNGPRFQGLVKTAECDLKLLSPVACLQGAQCPTLLINSRRRTGMTWTGSSGGLGSSTQSPLWTTRQQRLSWKRWAGAREGSNNAPC